LCNFEQRATDAITIADTDDIVGQSFDGEVLTELPIDEVRSVQLPLPVAVGFDLVDKDGSLFTPVPGKVTLAVSIQIQSTHATAATHRIFPYSGMHRSAVPLNITRKSDVH
jgi:hypothetical protein